MRPMFAAVLLVSGSALAQVSEPPVRVNTAGMPDYLRARIEAKAREGKTTLIRYLHRTRMIHGLRLEDVLVVDDRSSDRDAGRSGRRR